MTYTNPIVKAVFIKRPNRFIAHVELAGREEIVHVKNTGRCRELLVPGAVVYLEDCRHIPQRKTRYSLIAVEKGSMLVNMDSQAPNAVVAEALAAGALTPFPAPAKMKREVTYGSSRFDLAVEWDRGPDLPTQRGLIEVKGVTLEENGIAAFPDAPTIRGARHVLELAEAAQQGITAALVFLMQMTGPRLFVPHWNRDPAFGKALVTAQKAGVDILAFDARVTPEEMTLGNPLPLQLQALPPGQQPE